MHALFHDVEPVRIGEDGALFHMGHGGGNYLGVLLVRGQVCHQVRLWKNFLIDTHGKAVFRGVFVGLTFLFYGALSKGVGNVEAAVPKIEPLV